MLQSRSLTSLAENVKKKFKGNFEKKKSSNSVEIMKDLSLVWTEIEFTMPNEMTHTLV